jgi:hypothetical protein
MSLTIQSDNLEKFFIILIKKPKVRDVLLVGLFVTCVIGGALLLKAGYQHLMTQQANITETIHHATWSDIGNRFNIGDLLSDHWGNATIIPGSLSTHLKALSMILGGGICGGIGLFGIVKSICRKKSKEEIRVRKLRILLTSCIIAVGIALVAIAAAYIWNHTRAAYSHSDPFYVFHYDSYQFVKPGAQIGTLPGRFHNIILGGATLGSIFLGLGLADFASQMMQLKKRKICKVEGIDFPL